MAAAGGRQRSRAPAECRLAGSSGRSRQDPDDRRDKPRSHQQYRPAAPGPHPRDADLSAGNFQRGQHHHRQPRPDRRAARRSQPGHGAFARTGAHRSGTQPGQPYAFNDRMLFSDESTYQNLGFRHIPEEETAADKKAVDLLKNSPYAQKLDTAGLFLRQLAERGPALSALLTAAPGKQLHGRQRRQSNACRR